MRISRNNNSKIFELFFILFTTSCLVNFVMSSENNDMNNKTKIIETTVKDGLNYVATTPKIVASDKEYSRFVEFNFIYFLHCNGYFSYSKKLKNTEKRDILFVWS